MKWPLEIRNDLGDEGVSIRRYQPEDADDLFVALSDDRVWEHIPRAIPATAHDLDTVLQTNLIATAFSQGAAWIQFRTDERNVRSAAAIKKLGADDLGVRQDTLIRRDGSVRRSWFFRLRPIAS